VKRPSAKESFFSIAKPKILFVLAITIIAGTLFFVYKDSFTDAGMFGRLFNRAIHIGFQQDESTLQRVRSMKAAADLVFDGPVFIGVGLQSSPQSFYDGAIASIMVSSGPCGIVIFAGIILTFFVRLGRQAVRNGRVREFTMLFFVAINYLFANLITEFFLVSRSVVPFAVFLGLIGRMIHIPRSLPSSIKT
jgi:hypothetical protein